MLLVKLKFGLLLENITKYFILSKNIKFKEILKKIIFQLLMHSNLDELTWEEDPEEYLRMKYDVIDSKY